MPLSLTDFKAGRKWRDIQGHTNIQATAQGHTSEWTVEPGLEHLDTFGSQPLFFMWGQPPANCAAVCVG